jgi:hypothetical protein
MASLWRRLLLFAMNFILSGVSLHDAKYQNFNPNPAIRMSLRVKRSNLASSEEIATVETTSQ